MKSFSFQNLKSWLHISIVNVILTAGCKHGEWLCCVLVLYMHNFGSVSDAVIMFFPLHLADQTPTPTRFLRNLEATGLFNEICRTSDDFKRQSSSEEPSVHTQTEVMVKTIWIQISRLENHAFAQFSEHLMLFILHQDQLLTTIFIYFWMFLWILDVFMKFQVVQKAVIKK